MKYRDPSDRLTTGADNLKKPVSDIPDNKRRNGIILHKFPVMLSDGKTIVYIKDRSKELETRVKWEKIINKTTV